MDVRVLGPVRVVTGAGESALGGARERAVLAALALVGPDGASTDRLVDLVWGAAAPPTAGRTLAAYLSRVRGVLGRDAVRTQAGRHRLVGDVDAWRWSELIRAAAADPAAARDALAEALGLWRDPVPAADAALDGAQVELAALARARLDAAENLLDHLDGPAVAEAARALLAEDPHREHAWQALATALYRSGRQSEALAVLREARRVLAEELGLDPTPALARLEQAVLRHDVAASSAGEEVGAVPTYLTALVGRDALVDEVRAHLADRRLVSLVGVGGIGKTRVAAAVAEAEAAATGRPPRFVALASATTARAVEDTLAAAVGADADRADVRAALAARLRTSPGLVVLDNCEHVVTVAAALVRTVLAGSPGTRVLVTSRTPLGVAGEVVVDVPPLDVTGAAGLAPAEVLLRERAAEVTDVSAWTAADERDLRALSEELDGLPLALEVSARRLRTRTPGELRAELRTASPDTDAAGADAAGAEAAAQDPLAAALDRSVERLDSAGRTALVRLAAASGPLPRAAAGSLAGGGVAVVDVLLDASLLVRVGGSVRMYEPVRQHALRRATESERQEGRRALATVLLELAERVAPELIGPDELERIRELDGVHADVRASLEWAAAGGFDDVLARLAAAAGYLWVLGWGAREGRPWVERALGAAPDGVVRGRLLLWSAFLALRQGDYDTCRERAAAAVGLARELADDRLLGDALHLLAQPDKHGAGTEAARLLLREAYDVRRRAGDDAGAAMSLGAMADVDLNEGRYEEASEGYALGLPLMRRSGSVRGVVSYLHSTAELELACGRPERAAALAAEARPGAQASGDHWHAALLDLVTATAERDQGRPLATQLAAAEAALRSAVRQTDPVVLLDVVEHVGGVLLGADPAAAARLLVAAGSVRERLALPVSAFRAARRDADLLAAGGSVPAAPEPVDLDWLAALAAAALDDAAALSRR